MADFLKHILWATDYSEESQEALLYAGLFAKTFGARLSALHVVPDFSPVLYESLPAIEAELTGRIEEAEQAAKVRIRDISKARSIVFDDVLVRKGSAAKAICEAADKENADLIVIGQTGVSGAGPSAIGSVTNQVLRNSAVPVLVTKKRKGGPAIKKILVPTDFSAREEIERDYAWKLAKGFKGSLGFLYVMELFGHDFRLTDELFKAVLEKLKARKAKEHADIVIAEDVYKAVQAADGIVDYAAAHRYDMIAMSTHVGKVARFFLGSTTEKVIARSAVSVFAIPPERD
ncbi:MAG: universal stress protein [Candidatus Aminicenantales bacterium]|jgi:nucleotide-binding universal stress UspA family protein